MRKLSEVKLIQLCFSNPSQWQQFYSDNYACYVKYEKDCLTVYMSTTPVGHIIDCILQQNIVFSLHDVSGNPEGSYMTSEELCHILRKHNLLEE